MICVKLQSKTVKPLKAATFRLKIKWLLVGYGRYFRSICRIGRHFKVQIQSFTVKTTCIYFK